MWSGKSVIYYYYQVRSVWLQETLFKNGFIDQTEVKQFRNAKSTRYLNSGSTELLFCFKRQLTVWFQLKFYNISRFIFGIVLRIVWRGRTEHMPMTSHLRGASHFLGFYKEIIIILKYIIDTFITKTNNKIKNKNIFILFIVIYVMFTKTIILI